ncbi:MAG: hypothetical protein HDT26_02155 [Subdoligranulum sp.]|nr:hypothetical protein [Subdoligranulum sp.]
MGFMRGCIRASLRWNDAGLLNRQSFDSETGVGAFDLTRRWCKNRRTEEHTKNRLRQDMQSLAAGGFEFWNVFANGARRSRKERRKRRKWLQTLARCRIINLVMCVFIVIFATDYTFCYILWQKKQKDSRNRREKKWHLLLISAFNRERQSMLDSIWIRLATRRRASV